MKTNIDALKLTDDPLKNILIMAPLLDEAGQNRVFGLMCGLIKPCEEGRRKADSDGSRIRKEAREWIK